MTQPAWPFSLVHSPSYPDEGVPTHTELNLLQEQVAVAADGRVYTDIAVLKTWTYGLLTTPASNQIAQSSVIYDPVSRRWIIGAGTTDSEAIAYWTITGTKWNLIGTSTFGGSPLIQQATTLAHNGAGVILAGGTPLGGSSAGKLRESSNGGDTWITRNIAAADANGVKALGYHPELALWAAAVGGLSGSANCGIYTSPDRTTWTNRTSSVYSYIAVGGPPGSPVFLATQHQAASPSASYLRSTDGITWSGVTPPWSSATNVGKPVWSDSLGKWVVHVQAEGIWSSPTALNGTWTQVNTFSLTQNGSIGAFGRLLLRGDGQASVDGGVTWFPVLELVSQTDLFAHGSIAGAVLVRAASREVYLSHQIGF